jgi:hypothetical protein
VWTAAGKVILERFNFPAPLFALQIHTLIFYMSNFTANNILSNAIISFLSRKLLFFIFKIREVIPKPALVAKMRTFFCRQGGRSSNSCRYRDADRRSPAGKRAICSPNEVLGWLLRIYNSLKDKIAPQPLLCNQNPIFLHNSAPHNENREAKFLLFFFLSVKSLLKTVYLWHFRDLANQNKGFPHCPSTAPDVTYHVPSLMVDEVS